MKKHDKTLTTKSACEPMPEPKPKLEPKSAPKPAPDKPKATKIRRRISPLQLGKNLLDEIKYKETYIKQQMLKKNFFGIRLHHFKYKIYMMTIKLKILVSIMHGKI